MQRPSGKSLYRSNSNENSNECQTSSYREISNHINNQNLYLKILRQCSIYCLEKRKKCAHKCPQKERGLRGRVDEDKSLEFRSVGFWATHPLRATTYTRVKDNIDTRVKTKQSALPAFKGTCDRKSTCSCCCWKDATKLMLE